MILNNKIIVNWYGLKTFETIGEDLHNGWWYIKMDNEYHHIEKEYVTRLDSH